LVEAMFMREDAAVDLSESMLPKENVEDVSQFEDLDDCIPYDLEFV
jgi:hypothetical protein